MRRGKIFLVLLLLLYTPVSFAADSGAFQFNKQPQLQQVRPKKPVRIKLKRTSKDDYSWELAGDDVDEIVRADKRLRKLLGVQQK
jgi:hypothetical protein